MFTQKSYHSIMIRTVGIGGVICLSLKMQVEVSILISGKKLLELSIELRFSALLPAVGLANLKTNGKNGAALPNNPQGVKGKHLIIQDDIHN